MTGPARDISAVSVPRHGVLQLTFADGLTGEVEVLGRMNGPVFEQAVTAPTAPTSLRTRSTGALGPTALRGQDTIDPGARWDASSQLRCGANPQMWLSLS